MIREPVRAARDHGSASSARNSKGSVNADAPLPSFESCSLCQVILIRH